MMMMMMMIIITLFIERNTLHSWTDKTVALFRWIKTYYKKKKKELWNIMNLRCSKKLHSKQSKNHDEKEEQKQ